jgi:ATP-dependent DNA helicase DinG
MNAPAPHMLRKPLATFFGAGGRLARILKGYEERPQQEALAAAVDKVLRDGGQLLAEAGTGTGKTLAYLLPAVLLDRRVVISTGTKNLQEQLVQKDLPLLARALNRPLDVALMKGRGNYVCRLRLASFSQAGTFTRREEIPLFRAVSAWAEHTETGDRAEVEDLPDNVEFWREVSAASDNCIGAACPEMQACWITQMRQRALEANVVVVNHHLLCADLAVKEGSYGQVIPPYDAAILDEAHMLEDVATRYFGAQVSNHRVSDLSRDVEREMAAARLDVIEVRRSLAAIHAHAEAFFALVGRQSGRRLGPHWRSLRAAELSDSLMAALDRLGAALKTIADPPEGLKGLTGRTLTLRDDLHDLAHAEDDDHVYFVETRGRGVFLRSMPIDVAPLLRSLLFDPMRAVVLTSATLAVDGGFGYVRARLGIQPTDELLLPSPFDYSRQAVLYVPRGMPDPQSPAFVERVAEEVEALLDRSHGRAFVLFTSYANMNAVAERLAGTLPFPIFIQGEAPKPVLLDAFRSTAGAVLFATASFWQGVDVVGEQLSCVIIDKLPFASPADPVVSARIDRLRARGENPFGDYQVPDAILSLEQGLGRLIRSRRDRGVLAVLDSRLIERPYGRRFLESLPPARLVHDLAEVEGYVQPTNE